VATWLRQSTAREIKLGPFVDQTDGFTAEGALTIAQADVRLAKNEGDWAQKNEATTLVHEENGWYRCLLNATDTDTLGILIVAVNEAGALPVWREFLVVPANVWDSYLGADLLQVDVTQVGGTAQTAGDIMADTNDIQARLPAALVGGRIAANAEVVGDKTGYALTAADKEAIISSVGGTADASTTLTFDDAARTESAVNYWQDAIVVFTAGPAAWQPRRITAFDPTLDRITVSANWTTAPGLNPYLILRTALGGSLGFTPGQQVDVDTVNGLALNNPLGGDLQVTVAEVQAGAIVASSFALDAIDATALAPAATAEVADRVLGRSIAGGADGGRTVTSALRRIRNRVAIAAGTLTAYQENDTTADHTAAVTTAPGDPITQIDPA